MIPKEIGDYGKRKPLVTHIVEKKEINKETTFLVHFFGDSRNDLKEVKASDIENYNVLSKKIRQLPPNQPILLYDFRIKNGKNEYLAKYANHDSLSSIWENDSSLEQSVLLKYAKYLTCKPKLIFDPKQGGLLSYTKVDIFLKNHQISNINAMIENYQEKRFFCLRSKFASVTVASFFQCLHEQKNIRNFLIVVEKTGQALHDVINEIVFYTDAKIIVLDGKNPMRNQLIFSNFYSQDSPFNIFIVPANSKESISILQTISIGCFCQEVIEEPCELPIMPNFVFLNKNRGNEESLDVIAAKYTNNDLYKIISHMQDKTNEKICLKLMAQPYFITTASPKNTPIETIIDCPITESQHNLFTKFFQTHHFKRTRESVCYFFRILSKIMVHPYLINGTKDIRISSSMKLVMAEKLMLVILESMRKVVVYTHFDEVVSLINSVMVQKGLNAYQITSKTEENEKMNILRNFNQSNDSFVLLLSQGAVTDECHAEADDVIIIDSDISYALDECLCCKFLKEDGHIYRLVCSKSHEFSFFTPITSGSTEAEMSITIAKIINRFNVDPYEAFKDFPTQRIISRSPSKAIDRSELSCPELPIIDTLIAKESKDIEWWNAEIKQEPPLEIPETPAISQPLLPKQAPMMQEKVESPVRTHLRKREHEEPVQTQPKRSLQVNQYDPGKEGRIPSIADVKNDYISGDSFMSVLLHLLQFPLKRTDVIKVEHGIEAGILIYKWSYEYADEYHPTLKSHIDYLTDTYKEQCNECENKIFQSYYTFVVSFARFFVRRFSVLAVVYDAVQNDMEIPAAPYEGLSRWSNEQDKKLFVETWRSGINEISKLSEAKAFEALIYRLTILCDRIENKLHEDYKIPSIEYSQLGIKIANEIMCHIYINAASLGKACPRLNSDTIEFHVSNLACACFFPSINYCIKLEKDVKERVLDCLFTSSLIIDLINTDINDQDIDFLKCFYMMDRGPKSYLPIGSFIKSNDRSGERLFNIIIATTLRLAPRIESLKRKFPDSSKIAPITEEMQKKYESVRGVLNKCNIECDLTNTRFIIKASGKVFSLNPRIFFNYFYVDKFELNPEDIGLDAPIENIFDTYQGALNENTNTHMQTRNSNKIVEPPQKPAVKQTAKRTTTHTHSRQTRPRHFGPTDRFTDGKGAILAAIDETDDDNDEENDDDERQLTMPNGQPAVFPIEIGTTLKILELGKVRPEKDYYTDKYLYNPGFKSAKMYYSTVDPDDKIWYTSRIEASRNGPVFIVENQEIGVQFKSPKPSGAWICVIKGYTDQKKRRGEDFNRALTVSGPEFFGLSAPLIRHLFSQMPGVEKCHGFVRVKSKRQEFAMRPVPIRVRARPHNRFAAASAATTTTATATESSLNQENENLILEDNEFRKNYISYSPPLPGQSTTKKPKPQEKLNSPKITSPKLVQKKFTKNAIDISSSDDEYDMNDDMPSLRMATRSDKEKTEDKSTLPWTFEFNLPPPTKRADEPGLTLAFPEEAFDNQDVSITYDIDPSISPTEFEAGLVNGEYK